MIVQNLKEAYASIYTESDEFLSEDSKEYGVGGQAPSPGGVNPPQPKKPLPGTVDRKNRKNIETLEKKPSIEDSVDLFDIIKGHLLDEGYADTEESAIAIMSNMSEDWKQSIVEEVLDERNRGEQGMSNREVKRRRNLGLRNPELSSSALGDHGPQRTIQKIHKELGKKRTAEHNAERYTRGDLGRVSGTGPASRYQSNDQRGYPSISGKGGPF